MLQTLAPPPGGQVAKQHAAIQIIVGIWILSPALQLLTLITVTFCRSNSFQEQNIQDKCYLAQTRSANGLKANSSQEAAGSNTSEQLGCAQVFQQHRENQMEESRSVLQILAEQKIGHCSVQSAWHRGSNWEYGLG